MAKSQLKFTPKFATLALAATLLALPACEKHIVKTTGYSGFDALKEIPKEDHVTQTATGTVTVITVEAALHYLQVNTTQGSRVAWWDDRSHFFNGDQQVDTFPVKSGDTIEYKGIEANNEIYMTVIKVLPKK